MIAASRPVVQRIPTTYRLWVRSPGQDGWESVCLGTRAECSGHFARLARHATRLLYGAIRPESEEEPALGEEPELLSGPLDDD